MEPAKSETMNAAADPRTDRVLVVSEMAEYLRCGDVTVRRMIKRGDIKGWFRIGQEYRIRMDVLQAAIAELYMAARMKRRQWKTW